MHPDTATYNAAQAPGDRAVCDLLAREKAAEARFTAVDQVSKKSLKRWLAKAREIQWDYEQIVRNRGLLKRRG